MDNNDLIHEEHEEEFDDESQCCGNCREHDISCEECDCPGSCCDRCGCYGDCYDEDVACEDCRCSVDCCERCGCSGDCEDDDVACEDCRCLESCCENCDGNNKFNSLSDEEKVALISEKLKLPKDSVIKVVKDRDVNGFTDGNRVLITSGAVENLSEEELAFLLGHEQAHIDADHVEKTRKLFHKKIDDIKNVANDKKTGFFKKTLNVLGETVLGALEISAINHQQELEADKKAQEKIKEAGYSGAGGRDLMDRFDIPDRGISLTHPHPKTRKKKMQ